MLKKINTIIGSILALKIFFWAEPNSKKFVKGLFLTLIFIILVLYSHNEYLNWVDLSGDKSFLSKSFLLKNFLILLSLIILFFYLKKKEQKIEKSLKKVEGEEKIYSKETKEDYFEQFRGVKELRSKTDILLNRKKNEKK